MIEETTACREAALNGRLTFLNTGSGTAAVRIYGGARPGSVNSAPGSSVLVNIPLSAPAGTVATGQLTLSPSGPGTVSTGGTATWARVVNRNGDTAFDMDVGLTGSGAECILTQTTLTPGNLVSITSAVLT